MPELTLESLAERVSILERELAASRLPKESGVAAPEDKARVLDLEYATYKKNLETLLADEGKHVLIHGDKILGIFDTREQALEAGYERIGLNPFFVQQIERVEKVRFLTRNILPCRLSTSP